MNVVPCTTLASDQPQLPAALHRPDDLRSSATGSTPSRCYALLLDLTGSATAVALDDDRAVPAGRDRRTAGRRRRRSRQPPAADDRRRPRPRRADPRPAARAARGSGVDRLRRDGARRSARTAFFEPARTATIPNVTSAGRAAAGQRAVERARGRRCWPSARRSAAS